MNDDTLYVDTPAALADLCARLRGQPWLALDTEFMREKTYHPQLCLLQVAGADCIACVDPLALDTLDPLLDVLYAPDTVTVWHAARQDLEIFHLLRGALPTPLFDTQLAATLLGHGDQIGYAALVKAELDVSLDKSHTRTDWSQRPLDPAQLRYAANDVRYLARLYPKLHAELTARRRLDWLTEDFATLSDPAGYTTLPGEAWHRVGGVNKLHDSQLAILRALAGWREQRAQEINRPRKWVLRDEVLTDLARQAPTDRAQLGRIRGLDAGVVKHHGDELLNLIQSARDLPREDWPVLVPRLRLNAQQEAVADLMMALLRHCAQQHHVSPASLATRRDLEALLGGREDVALLHGWRHALAGQSIQALLRGDMHLGVGADQHLDLRYEKTTATLA